MEKRYLNYLKGIALHYHNGNLPEGFFSPLSGSLQDSLKELNPSPIASKALLYAPSELFSEVHYSWIIPLFMDLSPSEKEVLFSILPQKIQRELKKELKAPLKHIPLTPYAKKYFSLQLLSQWKDLPATPKDLLKKTEWTPFLSLDREYIVQLVDYLGLYDLSRELHPVVDGKLLRKVLEAFPEKKSEFIRRHMRQKPRILASPFGIKKWDGNPKKLRHFTHFRGLVWFAQVISQEGDDFWWYLTRKLDVGRGNILNKARSERKPEEIKRLAEPVKQLLDRFKVKEKVY